MSHKIQQSGDRIIVTDDNGNITEIELSNQEDAPKRQANQYAIKAVGDEGFAGYTAVWGSEGQTDLQGEYFTPDTDFVSEAYPTRPLIYHHGQNAHMGRAIIGTIKSWHKDETGLWCEGVFKALSDDIDIFDEEERALRSEYIKRIKDKIAAGELNFSSGAISHLVKYLGNRIGQWWWAESSATGSPAEPRMTDISLLKAYKGLDIEIPAKDAIVAPPETQVPQEAVTPGSETGNEPNNNELQAGEQDMNPEELIEQVLASFSEGIADGTITPEMVEAAAARLMEMVGEREEAAMAANEDEEVDKADEDEDEEKKTDEQRLAAAMTASDAAEFMTEVKTMVEGMMNAPKLTPDKVKALLASPTPRGSGGVNAAPAFKGGNMGISDVKTRYEQAGWESADYAFVAMVMKKFDSRWNPDVDFQRSAAAATLKYAEERNQGHMKEEDRPFSAKAMAALNRDMSFARAAKANEVEHTTNTGFGLEWMPQSYSDTILEKARVGNVVAQLFTRENMPTSPHILRLESTDPTVFAVGETTDQADLTYTSGNTIPMTKIGTVKKTMTAGTLGVYLAISEEEIEDIGLDVVAQKRKQTDMAFVESIDAVLMNADSDANGNINNNGAALASTSKFRYGGGDGILHSPLKENTGLAVPMGAAPTLRAMRVLQEKLLPAYGVRMSDLVYIADVRSSQMLRNMEEVLTVDKYGPNATVLKGELGSIDSIPILVSDQIKASAADGLISSTAGDNLKGRIVLMYKPNWYLGERRGLNLQVVGLDQFGATIIRGTMRMATQKFDTSSASVLYNITITN